MTSPEENRLQEERRCDHILQCFSDVYRTADTSSLQETDHVLAKGLLCLLKTPLYAFGFSACSPTSAREGDSEWEKVQAYLSTAKSDVPPSKHKLYLLGASILAGLTMTTTTTAITTTTTTTTSTSMGGGEEETEQDKEEDAALLCFEESAALGCHAAMNELGYLLQERDPERAFALFHRAAHEGDIPAAWLNLARCYQEEIGVEADEARSFAMYERSGALGLHSLAVCHEAGFGTAVDYARSAALYREAVDKLDCKESLFRLHLLYERGGPGLERDVEEAVQWLDKAALRGHAEALRKRERMFDDLLDCMHVGCSCKTLL